MTLSREQLMQYNAIGYATDPHFLSPREVAGLVAELERFKRQGLIRNVSTSGDGRTPANTAANLQIIPLFDKSPLIRALPFHPKVVGAVSQLIGEPALLHLDQIFLKPAQHGAGTSWHQDNHYFQLKDMMMGIGIWIALHPATKANGTMHVVPGMFREMLPHTRDLNSDHHFQCFPPEDQAVAVELPAGGALFFAYGVPHCTRANTTDRERAGLALHFMREDHAPADLVKPDRRERPLVNGPNATGGEREYGVRVAGTFEQELEKALAAAGC